MQALIAHTPESMHMLDDADQSPLQVAARAGAVDCVLALLRAGAPLVATPGPDADPTLPLATPLHAAAAAGHLACLQPLIAAAAAAELSLDARDLFGRTALHFAAASGHTGCVRALVAAGADAGAVCAWGANFLHFAAKGGHAEAACCALGGGPPAIDATDNYGQTALHFAAERGDVPLVRSLLAAGADKDAVCAARRTPLCAALAAERITVVHDLVHAGASLRHVRDALPGLSAAARAALRCCVRRTSVAGACTMMRTGAADRDVQHAVLCKVFDVDEQTLRLLLNIAAGGCC